MFGWLTSKIDPTKIVRACVEGADALHFSSEEKAKVNREMTELWVEAQRQLKDENSIRSITRRVIAWSFCFFYLGALGLAVILGLLVPWVSLEKAQFVYEVAKNMNYAVLAIITFYFGPYQISKVIESKNNKT